MEYVLWALIIGMSIYAIIMVKKISKAEIYMTSMFAVSFGLTIDAFLDLRYNLYGYYQKGPDFPGLIHILLVYVTINALFLNYFPYGLHWIKKIFYIFFWSLFAVVYEYFAVQTPLFYYNGWKLRYSMILYPIIYFVLVCNLKIYRYLIKKNEQK